MSLYNFQRAFAKLIASPSLCESVLKDDQHFFSEFDLTEKEKIRLVSVIRQRGMSACCSLYRMNRATPLYTQLSNTCTLLNDQLLLLMEKFWKENQDTSLQFREEVLAFGAFLMKHIVDGSIQVPFLKDVLQFEIAINELSYLPEGNFRILRFEYDIYQLLYLLNSGNFTETGIEKSTVCYKLYLENRQMQLVEMNEPGQC